MKDEIKELLELAAKAMGYQPKGFIGGRFVVFGGSLNFERDWNPLSIAVDLVEMECQLEIGITYKDGRVWVSGGGVMADEPVGGQGRRAARAMASLRVAAEIGRRMV